MFLLSHVTSAKQMVIPVKHFRQPTIFESPKITHIFKNPSADYEKNANKEWEKNIIENLGLTKQDTYNYSCY